MNGLDYRVLAANSASSAPQVADAAQNAAASALADVERKAESGELEDEAKTFFSVASDVSKNLGLNDAASEMARADGHGTSRRRRRGRRHLRCPRGR